MPDDHAEALASGRLLRHRLEPAIKVAGSQSAFADMAGIPKDTLAKYLAGTQPGPAALLKMADAANMSLDELIGRSAGYGIATVVAGGRPLLTATQLASGSQRLLASSGPEPAPKTGLPDVVQLDGFVIVPRLEVRASAGPGRAVVPGDLFAEPTFAIREQWLRSLGVMPQNAEFVTASGDSMEPTIRDGDLMLVDRGYGDVQNGKIYVLVVDGLVIVKRLQVLATGALLLISDNERYPDETIPRSERESLSIEARVAWYGRAM